MTTSHIFSNFASGDGANIQPVGGLLYYLLPVPPGYWLPNSECVANREPCPTWDIQCLATPCSTTSGTEGNSWTPTNCMAPLVVQPCDWKTAACAAEEETCLLGKKVFFVPFFPR